MYSLSTRPGMFLLLAAAMAGSGGAVPADESTPIVIVVETTFENGERIDPELGLTIGTSPAQALLMGGGVEIRGVPSAYQSIPHGWVFDEGEVGSVAFQTPVHSLSFFAAVRRNRNTSDPVNGRGFATLLDRRGKLIRSPVVLQSHEAGARPVLFTNGLDLPLVDGHPQSIFSVVPIGSVVFDHTATGQSFLSVDDVRYAVIVQTDDDDDDDDNEEDDD